MHGVEDHHAGRDFCSEVLELSLAFFSAPDSKRGRRHYFISSMICCRSSRMGGMGSRAELHFSTGAFSRHDVEAAVLFVLGRKIIAEMRPAAFFPLQRRPSNNFRYGQQAVQVERRVPARIVFPVPVAR